ncbi:hypothetical protein JCM10295v2_005243 [Rhodotorula toruloides]
MGAAHAESATKNVVVLGTSYAGSHAAELLARTLPPSHRVVVVDRQSHFNHLYLHPRVSVVPGHAQKVFIPYGGVLPSPPPPPAPFSRHVIVHATVTAITDEYIELDRELLENERDVGGDEDQVEKLTSELEEAKLDADSPREKRQVTRRLAWDYLIYALGCTLPPPLTTTARTKKDGVAFLESQQRLIASASSILIAGGGALGIQYASDIADLYNNPSNASLLSSPPPPKKRITLVHSRDRFLPLYKQEVHEEVLRRLEELGVDVVLRERVQLPDAREDEPGTMKTLMLKDGREFEYDLLLRCTGQKPNSQLFRDFLPGTLDEWGYINIRPTLQVDVSKVPDADRLSEKVKRNIYAIGDVANAGVIKAGHTGWNQAGFATQNIMCCIETDALNASRANGEPGSEPEFVEYERTPPQIKVTLGLRHSVSELLPDMQAKETVVQTGSDGPVDGHYKVVWERMGADPSDVSA